MAPPGSSGARAGERRGERATGQDPDEVAAEVGRAALVADRPRGLDRHRGRPLDQLRRDGMALEDLLGLRWPGAGVGATAARAIRAFVQTPFDSVSCEATPTTAMSSSRRGVCRR